MSRLNELQEELEERMRKIYEVMKGSFYFSRRIVPSSDPTQAKKTRTRWKIRNRLEPLNRLTQETSAHLRRTSALRPMLRPVSSTKIPSV